jgi:hypothetical protein
MSRSFDSRFGQPDIIVVVVIIMWRAQNMKHPIIITIFSSRLLLPAS